MFRAIYDSPFHNPAAFWIAGVAFLAWWARRRAFLVAYVALFVVEILADALATGGWSPLSLLRSPWSTPIAIAFVILGDFRYFLLVERFATKAGAEPTAPTSGRAWAAAAAMSLVVPIGSSIVNRAIAGRVTDTRWTFLVYEAMFVALAIALRAAILPKRLASIAPSVRAWLLRVTTFEIAQYALWVTADVIILAGVEAGFLLRVVPNAMYYAAFLPFVARTAPAEVDP